MRRILREFTVSTPKPGRHSAKAEIEASSAAKIPGPRALETHPLALLKTQLGAEGERSWRYVRTRSDLLFLVEGQLDFNAGADALVAGLPNGRRYITADIEQAISLATSPSLMGAFILAVGDVSGAQGISYVFERVDEVRRSNDGLWHVLRLQGEQFIALSGGAARHWAGAEQGEVVFSLSERHP